MSDTADDATTILGHDAGMMNAIANMAYGHDGARASVLSREEGAPANRAKIHAMLGDMREAGLRIDERGSDEAKLGAVRRWKGWSRIGRDEAQGHLGALLEGLGRIRADESIPVMVESAWLYGSLTTDQGRVGDVDVALAWAYKKARPSRDETMEARAWASLYVAPGDLVGGTPDVSRAAFAKAFPDGLSERVSFVDIGDLIRLDTPCRRVWTSEEGLVEGPLLGRHPEARPARPGYRTQDIARVADLGNTKPVEPLDPGDLSIEGSALWTTGACGRPQKEGRRSRRDGLELRDGAGAVAEVAVRRHVEPAGTGPARLSIVIEAVASSGPAPLETTRQHVDAVRDVLMADGERLKARGAGTITITIGASPGTMVPDAIRGVFNDAARDADASLRLEEAERCAPVKREDGPRGARRRRLPANESMAQAAVANMATWIMGRKWEVHSVKVPVRREDLEAVCRRPGAARTPFSDAITRLGWAARHGSRDDPDGPKDSAQLRGGHAIERLLDTFAGAGEKTLRFDRAALTRLVAMDRSCETAIWTVVSTVRERNRALAGTARHTRRAKRDEGPSRG